MTDHLQPDTIVDGRYRIEHRLGSGGMADVYCAVDQQLGRRVALKLLHRRYSQDPEFVERFRREASAAAGLQHRNVVSIYDRGTWDDTYYIAMEYLDGRTLKALINQEAPLDPGRAVDLTVQVLSAARFAHQRGIIHRDFKPQNVIVDDEGLATVTDFGIARSDSSDMTQAGSVMGTAQYLSPEQAQGQPVSAQSDLYSVGIILYELLTGRLPFQADSAVAIALKQVNESPIPPSAFNAAVTPALEHVVMRTLEKDPAARFASAEELIAALEAARSGLPLAAAVSAPVTSATMVAAPPPPPKEPMAPRYAPPPPPPEEPGGPSWWWFGLGAILVAAIAIAALLLLRTDQVKVPAVVGSDVATAKAALERAGFRIDRVERSSARKAGIVIGQSPAGGTKADKGSTVALTVSTGPGTAQVPSVADLTQAKARSKLEDAGFEVRVRREFSADVEKGKAIGTEPAAGNEVERGATVTLIVSDGAEQVEVPGVVGKERADAESALRAAGFAVEVDEEESEDAEPGTVTAQTPGAGERASEGSTVKIVVATQPSEVAIPDTVGDDESAAIERLSGAGFRVRRTTVEVESDDEDGLVIEQDPAGGDKAKRGSTVTIGVGLFNPPPDPAAGDGAGGTSPDPGVTP